MYHREQSRHIYGKLLLCQSFLILSCAESGFTTIKLLNMHSQTPLADCYVNTFWQPFPTFRMEALVFWQVVNVEPDFQRNLHLVYPAMAWVTGGCRYFFNSWYSIAANNFIMILSPYYGGCAGPLINTVSAVADGFCVISSCTCNCGIVLLPYNT